MLQENSQVTKPEYNTKRNKSSLSPLTTLSQKMVSAYIHIPSPQTRLCQ